MRRRAVCRILARVAAACCVHARGHSVVTRVFAKADQARRAFKLAFDDATTPAEMLTRFAANNFAIDDPLLNTVGAGIRCCAAPETARATFLNPSAAGVYPFGALLNHSCEGNAAHSYAFSVDGGPIQTWRLVRFDRLLHTDRLKRLVWRSSKTSTPAPRSRTRTAKQHCL